MALGIVSDEEFQGDLENCGVKAPSSVNQEPCELPNEPEEPKEPLIPIDQILSGIIETPKPRGRNGSKETPDIIRKIIGEEYALSGRSDGVELAKSFGISPSSASAYGNSANSTATYDKKNPEVEDFIKGRKTKIIKRASAKVLAAINGIDEDKLSEAPAGVLANIAKSLSGVIKDLEPPVKEGPTGPAVQFIMYAPKLMSESSFGVIENPVE